MKMLAKLACVFFLGFSAQTFGGMTVGGVYTAIDSKCYMNLVITPKGVLEGLRSDFVLLTVNGEAALNECCMHKDVSNYGILTAENTAFLEDLSVYSGSATLTSCHLVNINVFNTDSSSEIYLKGETVVSGSITFENAEGHLFKGPNVAIMGDVVGGIVIETE